MRTQTGEMAVQIVTTKNDIVRCGRCGGRNFRIEEHNFSLSGSFDNYARCTACGHMDANTRLDQIHGEE